MRVHAESGIALVLVLWVLTVLMVIVFSFSFSTRTEGLSTLLFKERTENKYSAEAGIARAVMEMYYRKINKNQDVTLEGMELWRADGTEYSGKAGEGQYAVSILDESGKIDINTTPELILRNFVLQFGLDEKQAQIIVDSIMDWKDSDNLTRLSGAEDEYYASLPTPYKAKNAPFDTVEELLLVRGMSPELLFGQGDRKAMADFLTVSSKSAAVNIAAAPKEVLLALPGMTPEIADAVITFRQDREIANLQEVMGILGAAYQRLSQYITVTGGNAYSVTSTGHRGDPSKGYAIRATVVLEGPGGYRYQAYKSPVHTNR